MLFADGFWEIKNLSDTIAVVGLVLTLLSIWLAVYFARRDLQRTIEEARKEAKAALDRFALAFLQRELGDLGRRLREARDAIKRKEWVHAGLKLDDAEAHLIAAIEDPRLTEAERNLLGQAADDLTILRKAVAKSESTRVTTGLTQPKLDTLDLLIRTANLLDSRLRRRVVENDHGRPIAETPPPPPGEDASGGGGMGVPGG